MRLDEEAELEVVIRYRLGQSTIRLGELFGVDEATIRRCLTRRGVERRPSQARVAVQPAQVVELRRLGLSWETIAARLGCSATTARNRWKEAGNLAS